MTYHSVGIIPYSKLDPQRRRLQQSVLPTLLKRRNKITCKVFFIDPFTLLCVVANRWCGRHFRAIGFITNHGRRLRVWKLRPREDDTSDSRTLMRGRHVEGGVSRSSKTLLVDGLLLNLRASLYTRRGTWTWLPVCIVFFAPTKSGMQSFTSRSASNPPEFVNCHENFMKSVSCRVNTCEGSSVFSGEAYRRISNSDTALFHAYDTVSQCGVGTK